MFKTTILILTCVLITASAGFAQRHPKQMQKLETQVEFEYANFIDENKSARLADVIELDQFTNYVQNGIKKKFVSEYGVSGIIVQENGIYERASGVIAYELNKKTGFYKDVSEIDKFSVKYVASNDAEVMLSLQLNDTARTISISKNAVRVFPLEWLDPRYANSNVYVGVRLVKAERLHTPCSISEITDDVINKNRQPKCFEAGSPELFQSK